MYSPKVLSAPLAFLLLTNLVQAQTKADTAAEPSQAASAARPTKATQLERVEVSGKASDDASRRASSASTIVIGREEIERFGDSTVGEVLKRLPGVTTGGRPGRGGEIRMRGMGGGYTQVLVNGERMSPGFSLDQLAPDQVERIEVMRAPTAEFGARAVAGTINVVLREALARRLNDLRFGLASERGQLRPNAGWTRSDKLDEHGGAYSLSVNFQQADTLDDLNSVNVTRDLRSQQDSVLLTQAQTRGQRQALNMNARLQWRLGEGESFNLQPFAVVSRNSSDNQAKLSHQPPPSPPSYYYDRSQSHSESRNETLRLNTQWQKQIDASSRIDLRAGLGQAQLSADTEQQQFRGATQQLVREQVDQVDSRDRSWSLNGKYSHQLENEHSLVAGLEGEGTQRDQTRTCLQNGVSCRTQLEFGDELSASTQRIAAYVQDEWSVGKQLSFYAGLRGETILTQSKSAAYEISNRSSVWTPLLHGVWKFDEKSRDQIRASLTRSYRSPNLQDLIAQPAINSQFPCPANLPCGPNTVDHPDRSGNPNLAPELATGIDLAYESYFVKGGLFSANAFVRQISDLMRNVTSLQSVGWAEVPRWVTQPQNIGKAITYGLELEAKFRLDEFFPEAWPVQMRSNVSLFRSSV
ncbi:TonB-dependent receptor plug domain-containing protein, partial [Roseateles sp.]|uniref:TonB-dependent receptor plug domain-containing protein n=1 Tax=Roseateles sp. TaxID=1971397 RepID=UPI00286CE900